MGISTKRSTIDLSSVPNLLIVPAISPLLYLQMIQSSSLFVSPQQPMTTRCMRLVTLHKSDMFLSSAIRIDVIR